MTENERHSNEAEEGRRRRVKVTDKRRVSADAPGEDEAPPRGGRKAAASGAANREATEGEAASGEATMTSAEAEPQSGVSGEAEAGSGGATMRSANEAGNEQRAETARRIGAPEEPADANVSELERARAQAAEYLDHLQRLKAEFENYRKRILREQTRAVEMASESLVARLLEVIDEFELALVAAEHETASEKFVRGVEMVYAKLLDVLKTEGLERIDPVGEPFDPQLHEALLQGDGDKEGEPYVEDVLRTGYRLKGRVIRPAGVKVGRR